MNLIKRSIPPGLRKYQHITARLRSAIHHPGPSRKNQQRVDRRDPNPVHPSPQICSSALRACSVPARSRLGRLRGRLRLAFFIVNCSPCGQFCIFWIAKRSQSCHHLQEFLEVLEVYAQFFIWSPARVLLLHSSPVVYAVGFPEGRGGER
ncbi:hypothetical protein BV25DRAFT_1366356 [Artomyces pyxidatus]|uniref:Uncharacterized protein n=1 Tax=Artomyces pyxidatus TaxID=48021 RepID=A0ACB8SNW7_9AGAM|nr:hypothetical protein BV25DRAFT_1366356 [Artomyces pyxidatus]